MDNIMLDTRLVREAKARACLSISEIGRLGEISPDTVRHILRDTGGRRRVRPKTARGFAKAFGVPVDALLAKEG